jgi:hypothetical protein
MAVVPQALRHDTRPKETVVADAKSIPLRAVKIELQALKVEPDERVRKTLARPFATTDLGERRG